MKHRVLTSTPPAPDDPAAGSNGARKVKRIEFKSPIDQSMGTMTLEIQGVTGLLHQRFSEKSAAAMLGKQTGAAKPAKPHKDIDTLYLDSFYIIGKRPKTVADLGEVKFGLPATAFKSAAVRGASLCESKMTDARMAVFVYPADDSMELIEIRADAKPEKHIAPVRNSNGGADMRVRGLLPKWSATLRVDYNVRAVSAQQLVSWFQSAGRCVGVGDFRPFGRSTSGPFGTFNVVSASAEEPATEG